MAIDKIRLSKDIVVVDYSAETQSSQYIGGDFNGDEVFEFIDSLRKSRALLSDCYATLVHVYAYNEVIDGGVGTGEYEAEKQDVSITIGEYDGDQPDTPHISYTINYRGDGVRGKFNPTTGTFTAGSYDVSTGTFTPAN